MARSRNIKPGFFTNADLAELSPLARLLFAGLWTIADKAGRLRDRPKHIKGQVLPYDDCDVDALLNELATVEEPFINRYATECTNYIQINNWLRHQSPHHTEQESEIPSPSDIGSIPREIRKEPLDNGATTVRARRALNQESGIRNQESVKRESVPPTPKVKSGMVPPTLDEVAAYCRERKNSLDPELFWNHYQANGWVQGKNKPVKDWKACVVTWEKNAIARGSPTSGKPPKKSLHEILEESL